MTRLNIIVFIITCLLFSCEEDVIEDVIIYTDIVPDNDIQILTDSTLIFELDVNKDSKSDFKITLSNYDVTDHNIYEIKIEGISDSDLIAQEKGEYWEYEYKHFKEFEIISKNDYQWISKAQLYVQGDVARTKFLNDTYIGLRINNNIGYVHVDGVLEFAGIKIKDYAYNQTENNSILCAQTE